MWEEGGETKEEEGGGGGGMKGRRVGEVEGGSRAEEGGRE